MPRFTYVVITPMFNSIDCAYQGALLPNSHLFLNLCFRHKFFIISPSFSENIFALLLNIELLLGDVMKSKKAMNTDEKDRFFNKRDDFVIPIRSSDQLKLNIQRIDRRHIVPQAYGDVIEIGVHKGHNFPLYKTEQMSSLLGVDPLANEIVLSQLAHDLEFPVEVMSAQFEAINLPDEHFDCAVSTHTLCSARDPIAVLFEVYRILKPGGRFLFYEKGRHPNTFIAKCQDLISPFWQRLGQGCQLNRNIFRLIKQAGFHVDFLETGTEFLQPRLVSYIYSGVAIKA